MFPFAACGLCRPQRQEAVPAAAATASAKDAASLPGATQPASVPLMLRSKSEARILQADGTAAAGVAPDAPGMYRSQSMPSSTLLEASRRRLAAAAAAEAAAQAEQQLAADGTTASEFVQRYMEAIKEGNASWASSPAVSELFTEDARMVAADRQSFHGRAAIVRRLNQGVEALARMAGEQAELPTFELAGPHPAAAGRGSLVLRLLLKRGLHKMAFTMTFTMRGGKIAQLVNSRS